MGKKFEIVGNDISDGYHTFNELYDHRIALYIRLCNAVGDCCVNEDHYKGWDAVYLNLPEGQISYHIPSKYRKYLPHGYKKVDESYYDGHTSQQILDRLMYWRHT